MAFLPANFEELIKNPQEFAKWLDDIQRNSEYIPASNEADALAGEGGTPSSSNPYVLKSWGPLAGTAGTPSSTNKFVTNEDNRLGFAARGTFTLDNAALTVVPETAVTADCSIGLPTPLNSDAAQLMGSAAHLYVDPADYVVGVSFTVRTGDGSLAAGTEEFGYRVFTG